MRFVTKTGRQISDPDVRTAVRMVCCQREKQHTIDPRVRDADCDGKTVVCGKCDNTAWQIVDALRAL